MSKYKAGQACEGKYKGYSDYYCSILTYSRPQPEEESHHCLVTAARRQVEWGLPTALVLAVNLTPGGEIISYDLYLIINLFLDTKYRPERALEQSRGPRQVPALHGGVKRKPLGPEVSGIQRHDNFTLRSRCHIIHSQLIVICET